MLSNVYCEELEVLQSQRLAWRHGYIYTYIGSDSQGVCDNMYYSEETELKFHITPSTGDNKDQQYVYLALRLSLPPSYPHVPPHMTTTQSRGLSDAHIRR